MYRYVSHGTVVFHFDFPGTRTSGYQNETWVDHVSDGLCAGTWAWWQWQFGDSRAFDSITRCVMTLPSFGQLALYGLTVDLSTYPLPPSHRRPEAHSKPASAPQGDKDEKKNATMMQPERTD